MKELIGSRGYIVVRPWERGVHGYRFNGQWCYYATDRNIELFFSRADAEFVANQEREMLASLGKNDPICVLSVEVPFVATRSVGVKICKWAERESRKNRNGYYPTVKRTKEKINAIQASEE